jgi:hypothetical protein
MDEAGTRELVFVLLGMAFLFALAMVAALIFIRQWRREKNAPKLRREPPPPTSNSPGE